MGGRDRRTPSEIAEEGADIAGRLIKRYGVEGAGLTLTAALYSVLACRPGADHRTLLKGVSADLLRALEQ